MELILRDTFDATLEIVLIQDFNWSCAELNANPSMGVILILVLQNCVANLRFQNETEKYIANWMTEVPKHLGRQLKS